MTSVRKQHRDSILEKIRKEIGQLNFLVNNAGVAPRERNDILEATEESFEYVMKTNLQGPYFLSQAVAKWMVEQKKADDQILWLPLSTSPPFLPRWLR